MKTTKLYLSNAQYFSRSLNTEEGKPTRTTSTWVDCVETLAFSLPLYEVLQKLLQRANIDTRLIIASTSIRLHCISVENWIIRDVYSSFVPTTLPL